MNFAGEFVVAEAAAEMERFPPLFEPHRLGGHADVFAHATRRATEVGAGAVFHGGDSSRIAVAVVLEPEEPLLAARRVLFCGMNALAETLATDAPPERPIGFRYPDAVTFDYGLIGGVRLIWPEGAEDAPPLWLVLGAIVRRSAPDAAELRRDPSAVSLAEAGLADVAPGDFAARFCRHLLVEIDEWQNVGFKGIGQRYLQRLEADDAPPLRGIDTNGDLIVQVGGGRQREDFVGALARSDWARALGGGKRR